MLALVDKDMKVVREVTCSTSETESVTEVEELSGALAQEGFIINFNA